jgi:hypothetical protein
MDEAMKNLTLLQNLKKVAVTRPNGASRVEPVRIQVFQAGVENSVWVVTRR